MSRILIADDHAVTRAGYKQFFENEPLITGLGEASCGAETLKLLRCEAWDLLLLDIQMPDCRGLEFLHRVRVEHPELRVLVVSGLSEQQYAREVLRAGASGYLSKGNAGEELLKAVRTVLSRRRYVSESLAQLLAGDLGYNPDEPLHSRLSSREFQIFCGLATGRRISNISAELGLSVKTVSTYRSRILEKMGLQSNANMTTYALQNGIVRWK